MIAHPPGEGAGLDASPARPTPDLAERYGAYRRRQALQLIHLMPRDAVRPMVRAARAAGLEGEAADPLEMLVTFCESLLPLPPQAVWARDLADHPGAHLRDMDLSPEAPTADAPTTVEVRAFRFAGVSWSAELNLFRDASGWRGFIAFEDPTSGRVHRTALIFHEDGPADVRTRFLDLENPSLEAFLRSALP